MYSPYSPFFFFKQKTAYEIHCVTGVQTCALPIYRRAGSSGSKREKIGAPSVDEEPQDVGHLHVAIEHEAARTLGRDLPLGMWMQRNGTQDQPYFEDRKSVV